MMKYRIGNKTYYIGSTIIDKNITISDYSEAYHARWGHEELYKTLKTHLDGIEFHGRCEEFIKQELFAALGILTLNRIMTNYAEELLDENETFNRSFERKRKVNFKGQLDNLLRIVEPVIASDSKQLSSLLKKIMREQYGDHTNIEMGENQSARATEESTNSKKQPGNRY